MNTDEVCDLVQIDLARVRKIRAELVAPEAVQGLADTFSALGDPTRVRILDALSHGELCVCDLAAVLALSQSAVSHQLRLLRNIRLVNRAATAASSSIRWTTSTSCRSSSRPCSTWKKSSGCRRWRDPAARGRDDQQQRSPRIPRRTSAAITAKPTRLRRPARVCADGLPRSRRSWRSPAVPLAWSWLRPGGLTGCWSPPPLLARSSPRSAPGSRSSDSLSTSTC